MNSSGAARVALAVVLVLLHFIFRPLLLEWAVAPNLLLGGLLLAALRLPAGRAAAVGFLLGVLESAVALEGMGVQSMLLTLLGYLGARSRDLLWADARPFLFLYLAAGAWIGLLGTGVAIGGGAVGSLALHSLGSALLTAALCGTAELVVAAVWS